jgi:uncharacterized protein YndB with AHSA1/START domain
VTRDTIEREMTLGAPIERVWQAITDPREVSEWFGVQAEIDLQPGGKIVFGWSEGRFLARVEEVIPPTRFAYRWCLAKDTEVDVGPTTLVTFSLEPSDEGTTLRLVESGFASLPEGVRDKHLSENTEGWAEELGELAKYMEATAPGGQN